MRFPIRTILLMRVPWKYSPSPDLLCARGRMCGVLLILGEVAMRQLRFASGLLALSFLALAASPVQAGFCSSAALPPTRYSGTTTRPRRLWARASSSLPEAPA
jgi:hypothetical protein